MTGVAIPKYRVRLLLAATAATMVALLPVAAQAMQDTARPTVLVRVNNVSMDSAQTLAQGVCRTAGVEMVADGAGGETRGEPRCYEVNVVSDNVLSVTATPEVVGEIEKLLAELDHLPETHSFQIVVLAADRSATLSPEVPANVRQALEDVRDFLPYTGYSVLGSGWLRTSNYGRMTLPGEEQYIAELNFRPTTDPQSALLIEQFSIYRQVPMSTPVEGGYKTEFARREVVQSTFTINRGETVVVGTSKLNGGDTAVIVLLTAVQN